MIHRSLGAWWALRYPLLAAPRPPVPAARPALRPISGGAPDDPIQPHDDGTEVSAPPATPPRPPVWWTGGALGSALRSGRWSAWSLLGVWFVAAILAATG